MLFVCSCMDVALQIVIIYSGIVSSRRRARARAHTLTRDEKMMVRCHFVFLVFTFVFTANVNNIDV